MQERTRHPPTPAPKSPTQHRPGRPRQRKLEPKRVEPGEHPERTRRKATAPTQKRARVTHPRPRPRAQSENIAHTVPAPQRPVKTEKESPGLARNTSKTRREPREGLRVLEGTRGREKTWPPPCSFFQNVSNTQVGAVSAIGADMGVDQYS